MPAVSGREFQIRRGGPSGPALHQRSEFFVETDNPGPIYAQALQIARADSRVLAELGEPIQPLPNVTGSTHRTNDIVVTELTIPISGAHKHATLYAAAREKNGELEFYQLEVKVGGKADVIPLGG